MTLTEPCHLPACGREGGHDGPHRKVESLNHWRPAQKDRKCSWSGCERPAEFELNRRQRRRDGVRDAWWGYCTEHNYGRTREDGRVFFELTLPSDPA